MSHRLFAAIRPPAPVRQALLAIMGGVEGARWQGDDQLHLTVRFIGSVDGDVAEDAALALSNVRHPAFEARFDEIGAFDTRGRIDTLWAGVKPTPALVELHRKVDRALVTVGLEPERRAYKPHITLARLTRRAGDASVFVTDHGGAHLPGWTVARFSLFESRLGRDGAHYAEVARYPLR